LLSRPDAQILALYMSGRLIDWRQTVRQSVKESAMPDPTSLSFDFNKNILGAASSGGIVITPTAGVLAALVAGEPFPAGPITLASASLQTQGSKDVVFGGDGQGNVTFSAKAAASLAVNADPAQVVAQLNLADSIAGGVSFPADPESSWEALQWSYDLQGAGKGSVGLGSGVTATFGADAKQTGAFALLHRFAPTDPARQALEDLVASWRLPRQVGGIDDLRPGTWLIAELDGSLSLSLGVQYGYLFNWLRQVEGKLAGDIALRLQLGLSATIGFTASGRYALVVSRPSSDPAQKVLRLQLFKQRKQGWNFAFDAGAQAQADLHTVLPPTLEGLLRAVLNVQDGQILSDLQEWLDPAKDLGAMLSNAGADYAEKFLGEVTAVQNVSQKLTEARAQLSGFLQKWDTLDQRVAASLWARIEDEKYVAAVSGLAQRISDTLGNETVLRTLLTQQVQKVNFFTTPEGQWLSAQATGGILQLIESSQQLQKLRKAADQTLAILSEPEVLELVQRLKAAINERFGLDKVEADLQKAIDASDPAKLDAWLRGRLTTFLDATPAVQQLKDIKNAINALRDKGQALYAKTLKALQQQYQADLAVTYQQTAEGTALLDIEFDFSQDGAQDGGALGALLQEALHGSFDRLFLEVHPGVTLNKATLSHQIRRERHIDLTLPSSFAEMGSINQALASVTALDDGGRVLLYEASGVDDATFATAKTRRDSRLSLAAQLPVRVSGLRQHETASLTYSYSFHQATKNLRKDQLETQVGAYAERYFPAQFPADGDGTSSGAFSQWADDLDREAEGLEKNGAGNLGNTLVTLELGVPPAVGTAWLQAPAGGDPRYLDMSLRLQRRLKELIPFYYFRDLSAYGNPSSAALLAWAALPVTNWVKIQGGALVADGSGRLHWNYPDSELLAAMVGSVATDRNLERQILRIQGVLGKVPGLSGIAKQYANAEQASADLRARAVSASQHPFLFSLLNVESRMVNGAAAAGAKMAAFQSQAAAHPEKAIAALADFASALSSVFNELAWSIYGKDALRPLGTLLFAEAATALDPTLSGQTSALLRIAILKQSAQFPPAQFPDDSALTADQVLIEQAVVSGS
jgi:hypothetical protein